MTETGATYTTEERLPECETGSVERMLEAAIEWNERMATYVEAEDPCFDEHHCRIVNSQTKLLRNILAKMQQQTSACTTKIYDGPIVLHRSCPHCNGSISASLFRSMVKQQTCTMHRQVCPHCNDWLVIESTVYG